MCLKPYSGRWMAKILRWGLCTFTQWGARCGASDFSTVKAATHICVTKLTGLERSMFPMTKTCWALYFSLTWLDATLLYFEFWGGGHRTNTPRTWAYPLYYWVTEVNLLVNVTKLKITLNYPPLKSKWDKKFYFILCYVFIHLSVTVI